MNLTDLANARSGFSQEMNNLLTLVAGSHTPEQRSAQILTATTECFTLCKTAKAVRVANPNSIATSDFFARADLPLCELMDGFHVSLGGKHMYEMFCTPPDVAQVTNPACTNPQTRPEYVAGPMVLSYIAGDDQGVYIFGFQGTIEYSDGTIVNYDTPTDIERLVIPDDIGEGYGTIRLRGHVETMNLYGRYGHEYDRDLVNCWQFGTECVVTEWSSMFFRCRNPCFTVSAIDSPLFGVQSNGDEFGTVISYMFGMLDPGTTILDLSNWDVSNVTSMNLFVNGSTQIVSLGIAGWDVSNVTNFSWAFRYCKAYTEDLTAWDTSSATIMQQMFRDALVFTHDLSHWSVANVYEYTGFGLNSGMLLEQYPQFPPGDNL